MQRKAGPAQENAQAGRRDDILTGFLRGLEMVPADQAARMRDAGICFSGDWFCLLKFPTVAVDAFATLAGADGAAWSEAQMAVELLESLRVRLPDRNLFFFKAQNDLYCLICGADEAALRARADGAVTEILVWSWEQRGVRVFVLRSACREGISGIAVSADELRRLQEYRIFHMDGRQLLCAGDRAGQPAGERSDIQREQEALRLYKTGRYAEANAMVSHLFDREYLPLASPLVLLKHKCFQYTDAWRGACLEICPDAGGRIEGFQMEERLLGAVTYPELRAQMEHLFSFLCDLALESRGAAGAAWAMDVKNYVRGRYADPALSVGAVADAFGLNPTVLSRRFQRDSGERMLDYIHRYRLQEAKIRIARGLRLEDVAAEVGYSSVLTMRRAFKKYEGTTPGQLRGAGEPMGGSK